MALTNQYLVEFDTYDDTDGVVTERFCTGKKYITKKSETPSLAKYLPALIDAGSVSTFLFGTGRTTGNVASSAGRVILNNASGRFDYLLDRGIDGREITIREVVGEGYPDNCPTRFKGIVNDVYAATGQITLEVKSNLHPVRAEILQPIKYAGTNDGTTIFFEGTSDLEGSPKPKVMGDCSNGNIKPILVDQPNETYQLSSDEITSIDNVYEGRLALTASVNHGTLAAFLAASPTGVTYDYYLGDNTKIEGDIERGCYIKLGTTPTKQITFDATEGLDNKGGNVLDRVLTQRGFTIDSTSLAQLNIDNPALVGIAVMSSETKISAIIDLVLNSLKAYLYDDASGSDFIIGEFNEPTIGELALTVNNAHLMGKPKIKILKATDVGGNIPVFKTLCSWGRNYTVMDAESMYGLAELTSLPFTTQEFRVKEQESPTTLTKHLLASEREIETALSVSTDADARATKELALYDVARRTVEIRIPASKGFDLSLSDVIKVDNRIYRIIGKTVKFPSNKSKKVTSGVVTIQAWGGS